MHWDITMIFLLQAYRHGLTLENGYVWLSYAWYPDDWWTEPANRTSYVPDTCSRGELEEMLEYSIVIDHYAFVEDKDENTSVGLASNITS